MGDGLETGPLTAPVDRDQLRRFRETLPTSVIPSLRSVISVGALLLLVVSGIGVWIVFIGEVFTDPDSSDWFFIVLILGVYAMVAVPLAVVVVRDLQRRTGRRQFLLDRFARANGMTYTPVVDRPRLPGMIFGNGDQETASDEVFRPRSSAGPAVSIANYRSSTGSGKNREQHKWGYVAVRLGVELPHIVLDAKGNNTLGRPNLPMEFSTSQKLGLEGDFDRHFTLYCPTGYEADALYLFTPDVMARFIDRVAELDVEIVDDHLFLYSRKDLSTLDPETWEWLFGVVDALAQKTDQWSRWRDSAFGDARVVDGVPGLAGLAGLAGPRIIRPPRGVARAGRRLAPKSDWLWLVIGVPVLLFGLYSYLTDLITP